MNDFTFIYLSNADICNERNECFVWFDGSLSGKERRFVRDRFYRTASDHFIWGDCFVFFHSNSPANKILDILKGICLIVPVHFVIGPDHLDVVRNTNNKNEIEDVMAIMLDHTKKNPGILSGDYRINSKRILNRSDEHIKIFRKKCTEVIHMLSYRAVTHKSVTDEMFIKLIDEYSAKSCSIF